MYASKRRILLKAASVSSVRSALMPQDPDFLRIYHSADKEWPGYKVQDNENASLPLLISEIFRLIPYIGAEYVHFYPKNMPDVTIDKVEIIGIVTDKRDVIKYTLYTVDDSTGAISVLLPNKAMSQDESEVSSDDEPAVYAETKSKLKVPHGLAPNTPYSHDRHIQNLWHCARDEKFSQDEIVLYDYVHVIGFCAMDFRKQKDLNKLTDEDMELGRVFFFGISARRLNEAQHNALMKSLISRVASERYLKPDAASSTATPEIVNLE